MNKPVVGVLFGSRSTEHDVSIITALNSVIKPLELSEKYDVLPIYIAKDGRWFCSLALNDIRLYTSGDIDNWMKGNEPVMLSFESSDKSSGTLPASLYGNGLKLVSGNGQNRLQGTVDVVFPALHGRHGEDGEAMGILEMAGVPYVGCTVAASAVAMDKVLTKLVAKASGIDVTKFEHFNKYEYQADSDMYITRINRTLRYPLFVKPAHLGSSIGITRVSDPSDLRNAIEVALHYDMKVLVEEGVQNLIEVTLPIMGNDVLRPALLERPMLKSDDFFDFQTKYMRGGKKVGQKVDQFGSSSRDSAASRGGTESVAGNAGLSQGLAKGLAKGSQGYSQLPAQISTVLYAQAEATGLAVYRALGCSGTARVDMLIDSQAGIVYCNEVNPLPGSLYAHNWAMAGVSNIKLVTDLIDLAIERHQRDATIETSFATSFLKQF